MSAESVAQALYARQPHEVERFRSIMRTIVLTGHGPASLYSDWRHGPPRITGPTISGHGLDVSASFAYSDATHFGTFPGVDLPVTVVQVAVRAYPHDDPDSAGAVDSAEAEGWARDLLGPEWAPFAYRVDVLAGLWKQLYFPVLVGRDGNALFAPADFTWSRVVLVGSRGKLPPITPIS